MENIDGKDPVFVVPEMFGCMVMAWARVEYGLSIVVRHFSSDEKILAKLNNPKYDGPSTYAIIEELKKHTRKEYEQFILEWKSTLECYEKIELQSPGKYSGKNFDAFIEGLHAARLSRNSLVHEVGKMELEHHLNMFNEVLKTGILPANPAEMVRANMPGMLNVINEHLDIISYAATPAITFVSWFQYTGRLPPYKL